MMIANRRSPDQRKNNRLLSTRAKSKETNSQWLSRVQAKTGLLLIGGNSPAHFRIRVAQSHVRQDLLPSFWSLAAILDGSKLLTVPLEMNGDLSWVPKSNAVREMPVSTYDDPRRFPNIAVLHFTGAFSAIRSNVEHVRSGQHSIVDLPSLLLPWLGFVWGAGQSGNPLLSGHGLPSAAFVETVFGMARIELTPGLSSTSSCPEAIWQSAKWWTSFYKESAKADSGQKLRVVPSGNFAIRQKATAPVEHKS